MRERPSAGCIPADIRKISRYLTYLLSIPDKGTPDKELGKLSVKYKCAVFFRYYRRDSRLKQRIFCIRLKRWNGYFRAGKSGNEYSSSRKNGSICSK